METYVFLREVAGSWVLVMMFTFFVATVIWVLTGRRDSYRDSADIIFRHDDKPAADDDDRIDTRQEARS